MTTQESQTATPVIVQFFHPGRECFVGSNSVNASVSIPWVGGSCGARNRKDDVKRRSSHSRRLVLHQGDYVTAQGRILCADLVFWTEWEARTTAIPLKPSGPHSAQWMHTVVSPLSPGRIGESNTDPCVFGSSFKYCCCQQTREGTMRRLPPGSMILFGSCLNHRFALDTVFVVEGAGVPYDAEDSKQIEGLGTSPEYRALALDRLKSGRMTFYRGRTPAQAASGRPYSFSPAKIFDERDPKCGERFLLDAPAVNRQLPSRSKTFAPILGQTQGKKVVPASVATVSAVWKEIVRQVRAAGFVLGVRFDWPAT